MQTTNSEEDPQIKEEEQQHEYSSFENVDPTAMYVLSRKKERRRILCNVILTSVAFMLYYTATLGTSIIQSSINAEKGLGTISLASFHLSSICFKCLSPYILRKLDPKCIMMFTFLTVVPYIGAQLYPRFSTLLPAAILNGMGSELTWTAVYIYMFSEAWIYAQLSELPIKVTIGNFFILFFMISNCSVIWSGAVLYIVLSLRESTTWENVTNKPTCGDEFCPKYREAIPNLRRPLEKSINIIMLTFGVCPLLAFITSLLCIKSLEHYHQERLLGKPTKYEATHFLSSIATFLKDFEHMLLLPLLLWFGAMRAFIIADLTQSFITCNYGIAMVGLTMIAAGVAKLGAACLTGFLAKISRNNLFALGITINCVLLVFLLELKKINESIPIIITIVVVWNIVDSLWIIQLNKILPYVFHRQRFSALDATEYMQTWQNLGSAIMYLFSPFICTHTKLYLILGIMILSTVGYIIHSLTIYLKKSQSEESIAIRSVLPFQ